MSTMRVKVTGLQEALNSLGNSIGYLNKKIPYVLQKNGNKMVAHAQKNHRFKTQSGQLERAIKADVDKKNWTLLFYIDDDRLTVKGGLSYGPFQHEGTGTGYKKSSMADKYSPKRKNGGIKADHFMVRAYRFYRKPLQEEMEKVLKGAFK